MSLADADTPLWLDAGDTVAEWLRFHCGAPITPEIGAARFALACGAAPSLEALDVGTDEDPQLGATLILQVAGLVAGDGWRLTGPGIQHEHRLSVLGAPAGFVAPDRGRRCRGGRRRGGRRRVVGAATPDGVLLVDEVLGVPALASSEGSLTRRQRRRLNEKTKKAALLNGLRRPIIK